MNLAQELKRKRDAEERLRQRDPAKSGSYVETPTGERYFTQPAEEIRTHLHDDDYLNKANEAEYIPTKDYHPATVKFVKDNTISNIHQTLEIMSRGGLVANEPVKTVVGTVMGWKMAKDKEFYVSDRLFILS